MKGRILKIKTGYNPNSSSIGLDMIVFMTAGAAVMVLFNTIAAILGASKVQNCGQMEEPKILSGMSQQEQQG
jgi:hypothetical protein